MKYQKRYVTYPTDGRISYRYRYFDDVVSDNGETKETKVLSFLINSYSCYLYKNNNKDT